MLEPSQSVKISHLNEVLTTSCKEKGLFDLLTTVQATQSAKDPGQEMIHVPIQPIRGGHGASLELTNNCQDRDDVAYMVERILDRIVTRRQMAYLNGILTVNRRTSKLIKMFEGFKDKGNRK